MDIHAVSKEGSNAVERNFGGGETEPRDPVEMKSPMRVGRPRSPEGEIKHPPNLRQGSYLDYGAKDSESERIAMVCEVGKEEATKKKNAK